MHYNKLLQIFDSTSYLSVGLDVGADFTWMSIDLPNGSFIGKPVKVILINPIITKNSTNINIRKLHNDKLDSKKAALVGLNTSLKISIIPDEDIADLPHLRC